jgi:hypothetical protein
VEEQIAHLREQQQHLCGKSAYYRGEFDKE